MSSCPFKRYGNTFRGVFILYVFHPPRCFYIRRFPSPFIYGHD